MSLVREFQHVPIVPFRIEQQVPVLFSYPVYFVEDLFGESYGILKEILAGGDEREDQRVLLVLDSGVVDHHPYLVETAREKLNSQGVPERVSADPVILPGGESCKNDPAFVAEIHDRIESEGVCRHSYVIAIGGGAVLDVAGFAAATAHRGVRLIRVPTTVLAQNDSGVGVKNGVNRYGKKNFLGSFAPPHAVINDFRFLDTLTDRDWRAGASEAVKVAIIKDRAFFEDLEATAERIAARDADAMRRLIMRCAELHLEHIRTSGDPFESGSSRPLDFGHWAAHKLEQLSAYEIRHGEAVAAGIALDCAYAWHLGLLPETVLKRVLGVLLAYGFDICPPELSSGLESATLFDGLEEFREHLGGRLTILLPTQIGKTVEVHDVDRALYVQAVQTLKNHSSVSVRT